METKESSMTEVKETTSQRASAPETSTTPQASKMEPGSEAMDLEGPSDTDVGFGLDGTNEENVDDIVGFSIGQEQLRMKSPNTPAYEKAQVLDQSKDYFDLEPEVGDTNGGDANAETHHDNQGGSNRLHTVLVEKASITIEHPPSPRGSPDDISRSDTSRSILRDGFGPRTRRASSESTGMVGTLRKMLPGLPSMPLPKASGLSTFGFGSRPKDSSHLNRPKRSSTLFSRANLPWAFLSQTSDPTSIAPEATGSPVKDVNSPASPTSNEHFDAKDAAKLNLHYEANDLSPWSMPKQRLLRRATSDHSLFIPNSLERSSTQDDAERWANVSEQINSRFKAITDSFQDSAFNRMPKIPSVSLGSFRPGLQGSNSDVSLKKDHNDLFAQRKAATNLPGIRNTTTNYSDKQPKHPHPILNQAVSALTGDVVVLGGYRGSILRSAKPPNKQLWVPVKVSNGPRCSWSPILTGVVTLGWHKPPPRRSGSWSASRGRGKDDRHNNSVRGAVAYRTS
jgi:hypothetical protein